LKAVLSCVRDAVGAARLHLYATTAELAAEINRLGVAQVHELGYPIDDRLRTCGRHVRRPGPLRITYAGDARLEKGFVHLPGIVDAVLADSTVAEQIQFVIQANFPFRLPCRRKNLPIVEARERLLRHDPARVRVLCEALDEAGYRSLVLEADMAILPYDARHYYARCSGVLVEMLSAGVPVIAPGGCSMSSDLVRTSAARRNASHATRPRATADANSLAPPGLIAATIEDFPRLVREMIADHARYRAAAQSFAQEWTRWHHPTRIVAEMLSHAANLDGTQRRSA
jgi:hypothetical protein